MSIKLVVFPVTKVCASMCPSAIWYKKKPFKNYKYSTGNNNTAY